jgi:hypothetical protein
MLTLEFHLTVVYTDKYIAEVVAEVNKLDVKGRVWAVGVTVSTEHSPLGELLIVIIFLINSRSRITQNSPLRETISGRFPLAQAWNLSLRRI